MIRSSTSSCSFASVTQKGRDEQQRGRRCVSGNACVRFGPFATCWPVNAEASVKPWRAIWANRPKKR